MSERARILLLSYHFPPSNAAGAARWDAFTRVGVREGLAFDVVCNDASIPRENMQADEPIRVFPVPDGLSRSQHAFSFVLRRLQAARARRGRGGPSTGSDERTVASAASVPQQVYRRDQLSWLPLTGSNVRAAVRSWLTYTSQAPWADNAVRLAQRLRASSTYTCVISSGPPFASHVAAQRIAAALDVPLVLDFRDPWSAQNSVSWEIASPLWFALADRAERACVEAASLVIMNTERASAAMRAKYPHCRVETVPNGFGGEQVKPSHPQDSFRLLYAGAIYLDRDPRPLLAGLSLAVRRAGVLPGELRLRFVGDCDSYAGMPLSELASAEGLTEYVDVSPPVSRKELTAYLQEAAMLVILPQSATLAIPSKVYENLYQNAWVLALERAGTATHELLEQTTADIVAPDDVEQIAQVLESRIREYRGGARPTPIAQDDRYRVERQAVRFVEFVQRMLHDPSADRTVQTADGARVSDPATGVMPASDRSED